jgi:hypothetical protein
LIVKTLVERLYRAAGHMDNLGNHALAHELRGTHVRAVHSAVDALAAAERVARATPEDWKKAQGK